MSANVDCYYWVLSKYSLNAWMIIVWIEMRWREWDFFLDWVSVWGDGHINWQLKHWQKWEACSPPSTYFQQRWGTDRHPGDTASNVRKYWWVNGYLADPQVLIISEDRQCGAHNNLHLYDWLQLTNTIHLLPFWTICFQPTSSTGLVKQQNGTKLGPVV